MATSISLSHSSGEEQLEQNKSLPSEKFPTKEFLDKNFYKADLQRKCRDLGIINVRVNKDQLIEMILRNTPPSVQTSDTSPPIPTPAPTPPPPPPRPLSDVTPPHAAPHAPHRDCSDDQQQSSIEGTQLPYTADRRHPTKDDMQSGSRNVIERHSVDATQAVPRQDDMQPPSSPPVTSCNAQGVILENLVKEIATIKSKLQTKDNEIELLNTEMKMAYTVIELLQQRITELEQQNKNNKIQQETSANVTRPSSELEEGNNNAERLTTSREEERYLLLGDCNLQEAFPSDLEGCSIRTIRGANVDLLRCWVSEKLTWTPTRCYIYAGLYDIKNNDDPMSILDKIAALVTELKGKNDKMEVFVSQLAPSISSDEFQARIADFNEHLNKWGESNEIFIIKTNLAFRFGTGEVDDLCYNLARDSSGCILNRHGVLRLLHTFSRQCPSFKLSPKWDNIKRNTVRQPTANNQRDNDMHSSANYINPAKKYSHAHNHVSSHNHRVTRRVHRDTGTPHYFLTPPSNTQVNRESYSTTRTFNTKDMRVRRGCYNCGEFNHRQAQCRFDYKLRCQSCRQLGHKSRLCELYTTH